jgi:glycosyltransferase involved in cell wall biosynthesis
MTSDTPLLFVLTALGRGGTERKTVGIVNALHQRGWNVHLAYLDKRTPLLKLIHKDVPVTHLRREGKVSLPTIRLLRDYVVDNQVQRIVCAGLYPLLYAQLVRFLRMGKTRPEIALMHNTTDHFDRKARFQMLIYRPLMRRATKIIFGCRAQRDLFIRNHGFDERKCSIIYNGIDPQRFLPGSVDPHSAARELGVDLDEDAFVVVAIGTLWPNKNHIELVNVLESLKDKLPQVRIVIAGEGPERPNLQAAARRGGVEHRFILLGEIEDVRPLLEAADVFVLPSKSETFSNATLEAMAMKKVVIANDTGGMKEMISDGVDGFIYNIGDIDYLATLIEVLAGQPARRREVGEAARATVVERFTFDTMIREYDEELR